MDILLFSVTVLSLAMAAALGVVVIRLVREERLRSNARAALLGELAAGPADPQPRLAPARPRPSRETSLHTRPDTRSDTRPDTKSDTRMPAAVPPVRSFDPVVSFEDVELQRVPTRDLFQAAPPPAAVPWLVAVPLATAVLLAV